MDNPPMDFDIDLREKLAHIDQMLADHDRKRQEMRVEPWKTVAAVMTAGAILFGALFGAIGGFVGFQLGQRAPQVIVQIPPLK